MSSRITRSRTKQIEDVDPDASAVSAIHQPQISKYPRLNSAAVVLTSLSTQRLDLQLTRLPQEDLALLRLKQRKLRDVNAQVPVFIRSREKSAKEADGHLAQAVAAALVFAGEAAGTAVCISPEGLLLTCSHCVAEQEEEYQPEKEQWLLFANGNAVRARCVVWDPVRDLALLQITAATAATFSYIQVADTRPVLRAKLLCIGHPGSEDFEADQPGLATGYDVLHISEGRFRGLAKGQDAQDNSEIGALMHDCWTYWGHSGAPLVSLTSGRLVGLHSSWDDQTAMRRGVAWEALTAFLFEHTVQSLGS